LWLLCWDVDSLAAEERNNPHFYITDRKGKYLGHVICLDADVKVVEGATRLCERVFGVVVRTIIMNVFAPTVIDHIETDFRQFAAAIMQMHRKARS
jgi:hypothetical protein